MLRRLIGTALLLGWAAATLGCTAKIENKPNLTPQTLQQGLFKIGIRPSDPYWAVGGGFASNHLAYTANVAEIWWDPNTANPANTATSAAPGAYRYARCGKRWAPGDIPVGDPDVFVTAGTCTQAPGT